MLIWKFVLPNYIVLGTSHVLITCMHDSTKLHWYSFDNYFNVKHLAFECRLITTFIKFNIQMQHLKKIVHMNTNMFDFVVAKVKDTCTSNVFSNFLMYVYFLSISYIYCTPLITCSFLHNFFCQVPCFANNTSFSCYPFH